MDERSSAGAKCGGKRVDLRPNWKEQLGMPNNWNARPA
jgi:hypothetical protein